MAGVALQADGLLLAAGQFQNGQQAATVVRVLTGTGTTTGGGTSTGTGSSPTPAPTVTKKSISAWVSCNGTSDDYAGVAKAFDAAKNGAFTLVVDCPVRIHVGSDIARSIFIDNGTTVEFSGNGKFTVDNVFEPAFVVANSSNITLTDWNLVYDASLPVDMKTGFYENDGERVLSTGNAPPSSAFTNQRITNWLTTHRGITFDNSAGAVFSMWVGPTNTSAVFYVAGDSGNITVTGMQMSVPATAGGERFIPMAFSLSANYKSNQKVTLATPKAAQYVAVPHNLNFTNIDIDGSYMGWQGNAQSVVIEKVRSHRYGDLQDANGNNVGGVGKWFAPPHLFYFRYDTTADVALVNKDISIHDVIDYGVRIGTARDKGGTDTISGFAESLKIGGNNCSVDQYVTNRPDGFLDVLASDGLKISNVTATYNSQFTNNVFASFRFPTPPYKNVTFQNITLTDTAPITMHAPIGTVTDDATENMVFSNVHVTMNSWGGSGLPLATFAGTGNSIALDYTINGIDSRIVSLDKSGLRVTLQATPATLKAGSSATINWLSHNATSCSGSGAWSGSMSGYGSGLQKSNSAGTLDYAYYCQNSGLSSSVTMPVVFN